MTADELGLITNIILDGARISKYNDNGKEIDIKLSLCLNLRYCVRIKQNLYFHNHF